MRLRELSIKQRLALAGIVVERIIIDGQFAGVKLMKNGVQCHTAPRASIEYGISLCGFLGV